MSVSMVLTKSSTNLAVGKFPLMPPAFETDRFSPRLFQQFLATTINPVH